MPDDWTGIERRRGRSVCLLHQNIEEKLDQIIGRQISQIEDIASIKHVVENGLKTTVIGISEKIEVIAARIEVVERFNWFAEWVTQLRNNLFKNSVKLAALGGAVYAILYFGDKLIVKWLGG